MSCPDKKLESAREELSSGSGTQDAQETDCVVTAAELQHLLNSRNISLATLPPSDLDTFGACPPLSSSSPRACAEAPQVPNKSKSKECERRGGMQDGLECGVGRGRDSGGGMRLIERWEQLSVGGVGGLGDGEEREEPTEHLSSSALLEKSGALQSLASDLHIGRESGGGGSRSSAMNTDVGDAGTHDSVARGAGSSYGYLEVPAHNPPAPFLSLSTHSFCLSVSLSSLPLSLARTLTRSVCVCVCVCVSGERDREKDTESERVRE
jgi:hypothetical protein